MRAILGTKIGMTQIWDDKGRLVGATVIKAEPNKVINQKDQLTTIGVATKGKTNKAQQKLAENLKSKAGIWLKTLVDLETEDKEITVDVFKAGEKVAISGISKGKGFAGVVKRHGFAGWPASHGHSHQRRPGSIGAQRPQHVLKGKKMAGHMGNVSTTSRGNKVLSVNAADSLIIVSGNVPGPARAKVIVRSLI